MNKRDKQEETGVAISLAISVGMIFLALIGWWLWRLLAPIAEAMFATTPIEMP